MRVIAIVFLLITGVSFAEEAPYKIYTNKVLGISFEYPSWADVEDVSGKGTTRVWFHIGKHPEDAESAGVPQSRPPASGVLFEVKSTDNFEEFIAKERNNQSKGGYRDEIIEKKYVLGENVVGIEFVRDAKAIDKKMRYLVFPSANDNVTLSLWHLEDTSTGFMGNPEEEAKAVIEYERMKNTLKVFK